MCKMSSKPGEFAAAMYRAQIAYPSQRTGQILVNSMSYHPTLAVNGTPDPFYWEDDDLIVALDAYTARATVEG